jgi:hypothetical protein
MPFAEKGGWEFMNRGGEIFEQHLLHVVVGGIVRPDDLGNDLNEESDETDTGDVGEG